MDLSRRRSGAFTRGGQEDLARKGGRTTGALAGWARQIERGKCVGEGRVAAPIREDRGRGLRVAGRCRPQDSKTVVAEDLLRGALAKHLAGAVVEPVDGFLQPLRVECAQVLGVGHELAQQAVGMFVEASLAGAVGQGKEEVGVERLGGLAGPANSFPLSQVTVRTRAEKGHSRFCIASPTKAAVFRLTV